MPKVSVVMPAYNAEKYIGEAIDSILNQTFEDFEFIIIDDCSSDRTAEIIKSYTDKRIRFYQNEHNMGVAATLNRGLDLATGEYIARMDSDDISLPERFEKQVQYMSINPNTAVLGAAIELFGAQSGKRYFSTDYEHLKVDLLFGNCFAHPAVMMRASCFGKGKLQYDNMFNKMEDFDMWVRTAELYEIASLPIILLKYRIHPEQVTQKPSEVNLTQLRMLKERQMKLIGVAPNGTGFESYISYCNGYFDINVNNVIELVSFFALVRKKNRIAAKYVEKILKNSFDAVIKRLLSKLSLASALRIAAQCGINPVVYGIERLERGVLVRIGSGTRKKLLKQNLKNKDFTIISNNCWGGAIYQKYGLEYRSPTVGLYILGHDFVKLCSDWERYMKLQLEFIPWESASYYHALKDKEKYPVAKLGDIEIYFMHYRSEQEAAEKWYRRAKRINPEKMIFKLSQREGCSKEDIEAFMALPQNNKVCFAYDRVDGAIFVPELEGFAGDESPIIETLFDELQLINSM